MPYTGPNDPKLPGQVPRMPKKLREIWVDVYNKQIDDDPQDEAKAAKMAYGAIRTRKQINVGQLRNDTNMDKPVMDPILRSLKSIDLSGWRQAVDNAFDDTFSANGWWAGNIADDHVIASYDRYMFEPLPPPPSAPKHRTYRVNYTATRATAEDGDTERISDVVFAQVEDWVPVVPTYSAITLLANKENDTGPRRWVGVSSGGFEDREGEIVSSAFLDDAIGRADKSGEAGDLRIWHIPGTRVGGVDFQTMHHGFLLESGLMDKSAAGQNATAWIEANPDARLSIQFAYKNRGQDGVYHPPGQIIERSILPSDAAAFPWASITFKEYTTMAKQITDEKREMLVEAVGEDEATEMLANLEDGATELKAAGVQFKELDEQAETEQDEDGAQEATPDPVTQTEVKAADPSDEPFDIVLSENAIATIAQAVADRLQPMFDTTPLATEIKSLRDVATEIGADVARLTEAEDDRVRDKALNLPTATIKRVARATKVKQATETPDTGDNPTDLRDLGVKNLYG